MSDEFFLNLDDLPLLMPREREALRAALLNESARRGDSLEASVIEPKLLLVERWAKGGILRVALVREVLAMQEGVAVADTGHVLVRRELWQRVEVNLRQAPIVSYVAGEIIHGKTPS